jgi:hypothetical protein
MRWARHRGAHVPDTNQNTKRTKSLTVWKDTLSRTTKSGTGPERKKRNTRKNIRMIIMQLTITIEAHIHTLLGGLGFKETTPTSHLK